VFVESKPSNSQQEITEKELMQNAQNNSHDKFQDSFHDSSEEDDFEIEDCATQLDLAKAYVAMGDVEQAQQALNDVINRGDEAQRQQAYQLLVQLASS
jgi:pilus assembly protein FimV